MCPELEQLERFASHALDPPAQASIDRHLDDCANCRAQVDDIRRNLQVLGAVRGALEQTPSAPALPRSIGRYRILGLLGRGGMGTVYRARQDRPSRTVALKVLNPDRLSTRMLRRFEHESELLARLQHPGIAQIYEVATDESEFSPRPLFAMEYVDGPTIQQYCRQQKLGTRQRLELLIGVCDAVQHAHQRGVIHRDLKPDNILVAPHAQPKVLDFGVARATNSDIQLTTMETGVGQLIGTIPYMSPEQAAGDPDALDTRSDVYALGVLAYELLSERLPYSFDGSSAIDALRTIREREPTPLSAIDRTLRGDIETIVGKALEKDRERRYQSAADLAGDIQRYLRDEPIIARPPSAIYQLRKFSRRNRTLVISGAAGLSLLLVGAGLAVWQAVRATRAEQSARQRLIEADAARAAAQRNEERARNEADKALAVTAFLQQMLTAGDPDQAPGQRDLRVRDVLDQAARDLDEGALTEQPETEAMVRTTIGNVYRSLGDYPVAEQHLRRAVQLGRQAHPDGSEELAHALNKLARLLHEAGQYDQAEPLFHEALEMRQALLGTEHAQVATILSNLGALLDDRGDYEGAADYHRRALDMRRRVLAGEHTEVATSLNNLAVNCYRRGDDQQAETLFRASLDMDRRLRGELHPNIASTMSNLGSLLARNDRRAEAEELLRRALDMQRELHGRRHPAVAAALNNLALLRARDDDREAEALYRESLDIDRELRGPQHPNVATTLSNLASILRARDDLDQARTLYHEALSIYRAALGDEHPDTLRSLFSLGRIHLQRNELTDAEPLLAEVVTVAARTLPAEHWLTAAFRSGHGECLARLGRHAQAERELLNARANLERSLGPRHRLTVQCTEALVALYEAWDQPEQAAALRDRLPAAD